MRTDCHRPSEINPNDYSFVAFEYLPRTGDVLGDALFLQGERMRIQAHMKNTGGRYSSHEHGGNCHICGSVNAIYTALFFHRKSNSYIRTGLDCAEKLECQGIEAFRRNVHNALEAQAGKCKAQAILNQAGLAKAWEVYLSKTDGWEENTCRDIVGKLVQYGSLSDKQISFVRTLLGKIENRAAIQAQREVEKAAAKPLPKFEGRVTIRGKVLSLKEPDGFSAFPSWKMLVQHEDGWKLWGSIPSSLRGVNKGQEVQFDAMITPSDRDDHFGFFNRPSKAKVII